MLRRRNQLHVAEKFALDVLLDTVLPNIACKWTASILLKLTAIFFTRDYTAVEHFVSSAGQKATLKVAGIGQ
jgi:hypothetical protein